MTNVTRNLVKAAKERHNDKIKKEYKSRNIDRAKIFYISIMYALLFIICSFLTDKILFSLLLSIFSLCTMIGTELGEWIIYQNEVKNEANSPTKMSWLGSIINWRSDIIMLLGVVIFAFLMIAVYFLRTLDLQCYEGIVKNIDSRFPNIITSVGYAIYVISTTSRNYCKEKRTLKNELD